MSIRLFKHNSDAYEIVCEMLSEAGKAAVIHPTGTGKSFIGFKLCEDNPEKTVCWLSPSEYIFKTQLENLKKAADGYTPENIKFYTYAKLMNLSEDELKEVSADFIVIDEFHRCGAEMWGKGVSALLRLNSEAAILGLSATAIRYLDNQRNMADELFDGNVASEITLGEAIVRGILNPPVYVSAVYSYSKDLEKYEKRVRKAQSKAVRDAGEKYLEALRRAIEMSDGLDVIFQKHIKETSGKYIVFCSDSLHMSEMIKRVPEWFSAIDKDPHIYSAYSSDPETSKAFKSFKDDKSEHIKLLFCIDMLNEGVHVEDISGVILFRPTVSPIVFKQQIGRALCSGNDKSSVIFDIVNNIENLYSISDLEEEIKDAVSYYSFLGEEQYIVNDTFRVIDEVKDCKLLFDELEKTLSASWEYMYCEAKKYYEANGDLLPLFSYETKEGYKLGQWVVSQRIAYGKNELSEERVKLLEAVGMSWLNLNERRWEEGYALAREYYDKNKNLKIDEYRSRLGMWIIRQRQNHKKNLLTKEQFQRLDALGMVWETEDVWKKRLEQAAQYYKQYGNLDIPAGYVTESGVRLGIWYRSVKSRYNSGTLSEDKIRELEEIGIQWSSVKMRNWKKYYGLARHYYLLNGDLNVNANYKTARGESLGTWISTQRYAYSKGKLSEEQIDLLNEIGMVWHRDVSRWELGFEASLAYYEEFGHINVPAEYVNGNDFALGAWIAGQRRKYKNEKLTKEQINRLNELDIEWDPWDALWISAYDHARDYYLENGVLNVNNQYVSDDGFKLGSWISNQKSKYKKGKLTAEQISKLEAIGMVWDFNNEKWMIGYSYAKAYFEKFGELSFSKAYVMENGYPLGSWFASQKQAYKKGRLDVSRQKLLESVGAVFAGSEV